ncbi:MAG: P-loop NTPase [Alphaproteobacteria bacterium]|nr:P-loop NTPase [Alphaproteobacteria bacterium]
MARQMQDKIIQALRQVIDPIHRKDIVSLNMIAGLNTSAGEKGEHVSFSIEIDPARGAEMETLRQEAERVVAVLPGVAAVTAVLTAHRATQLKPLPGGRPRPPARMEIKGIKQIVAVASGKGGVGKSTTAVNLALAMAGTGKKVGLLDADIYGPSVPRMLGIEERPKLTPEKKIVPIERHGLTVMSIGFVTNESTPTIWRGPMVMGAIQQMLRDVMWGELDILVVDMPPGTGDAQLTLTQQVQLAGAVIVSTPQDIALIDARKGLNMFRRVDVPVLGIIENMSFFQCPHCGERSEIFAHGGAREEAAKMGCAFLGEIPIDLDIRKTSDDGLPLVVAQPESPQARTYGAIARAILAGLAEKGATDQREAALLSEARS